MSWKPPPGDVVEAAGSRLRCATAPCTLSVPASGSAPSRSAPPLSRRELRRRRRRRAGAPSRRARRPPAGRAGRGSCRARSARPMIASFCGWRSTSIVSRSSSPASAAQDEVELPRDVRGVAQPGAQPLAEERRRQVGGVADEQHAPLAHPLGEHRAELVDGRARERPVLRAVPRLEQRPDALRVLEVGRLLVGEQHELPPPVPRAALHLRGRARRVAPLARGRQVREGAHVVGLGVDHEPALLEARGRDGRSRSPRARTSWRRRRRRPSRVRTVRVSSVDARDGRAPRPSSLVDQPLGRPAALDGDAGVRRTRPGRAPPRARAGRTCSSGASPSGAGSLRSKRSSGSPSAPNHW